MLFISVIIIIIIIVVVFIIAIIITIIIAIIIIIGITCFLFKAINYLFLTCLFSQNISVMYSISSLKYFSEETLLVLARNPFNMLVIVSGGIQECGLICTFVRAGFRWTSNSYLPLLFFILMSRKFKHFSSFLPSMVNWMYLSCLFKKFWNSRDCSLDVNRAWVSLIYHLYVFGARFKVNASAVALRSNFWM